MAVFIRNQSCEILVPSLLLTLLMLPKLCHVTLRPQTGHQDSISLLGLCMHNAQAHWQK